MTTDADNPMLRNLPDKTGKTLKAWLALLKKSGLDKHGAVMKFLKTEHGLTHGYANLIAHKHLKADAGSAESGDSLVDAQYGSGKEHLRPIYDKLAKAIQGFGADVELAPKRAYVSARRKKQFAILQPSTKTRFDVGLNLKGTPAAGRLEASGSFNSMCSHRVRLESPKDVDAELIKMIRDAYDAAG